jgi:hypothetical protein
MHDGTEGSVVLRGIDAAAERGFGPATGPLFAF